ncbi:MAG: hypothetical protein AAFP69_01795 [Planctomycetota bacterium]
MPFLDLKKLKELSQLETLGTFTTMPTKKTTTKTVRKKFSPMAFDEIETAIVTLRMSLEAFEYARKTMSDDPETPLMVLYAPGIREGVDRLRAAPARIQEAAQLRQLRSDGFDDTSNAVVENAKRVTEEYRAKKGAKRTKKRG